jgi:hypothetical protein
MQGSMARPLAFVTVALVVAACGAFSGGSADDDPKTNVAPEAGPSMTDAPSAGPAITEAGLEDAGGEAPPCADPVVIQATLTNDVGLTACAAANSRGKWPFINVSGELTGLLQFTITTADRLKLESALVTDPNAIFRAELVLHADPNCSECDAGLGALAGTLAARTARDDWNEGDATNRGSPDLCRRVPAANQINEIGWGKYTPHASSSTHIAAPYDYDSNGGSAEIVDDASVARVRISTADLLSRGFDQSGVVSLFLSMKTGRFIFATKETDKGLAPPSFTLSYCAP